MAPFNIFPLSTSEVNEIKAAAYRLLETTGLRVGHRYVLQRLADIGCHVDFENTVVKFPTEIVDEQLAKIPTSFSMGGRDADVKHQMNDKAMFTRPQSGCPNVLALGDGTFRPATQKDVVNITRLIDGLAHVDFCASLLYPWDVPPAARDVRVLQLMFQNTRKHLYIQSYDGRSTKAMIQMAEILRGSTKELTDNPPLTFIVGGTSPLKYTPNELEVLIEVAKTALPVMIGSTPIAGATAPVTIAGQILLQHVENIAGLVILQVLRPGCPVTYAARPSFMEMRTANTTWGNIEWGLATAAVAQLARSHKFLLDVVGLPSDSKVPDEQTAIEKAANSVLGVLSCPNVFTGVGAIETIQTGSFIQAVIDNEICGMVKRLRQGIGFDEHRMAENIISNVGPGGNFLTELHTVQYFRDETYRPELFSFSGRDQWKKLGSKDTAQRAKESAIRILKENILEPLDEKISSEFERIYQSSMLDLAE